MKRITILIISVVLMIMIFGVFAGCSNDYSYKEGDFSLEITVDKTSASIGDEVEITATLKNVSGQALTILYPNDPERNQGPIYIGGINDVYVDEWAQKTLENNATITKKEIRLLTNNNVMIGGIAEFYIGHKESSNRVTIASDIIEIIINEKDS